MIENRGETVVADELRQACSPWELQRAVRVARKKVKGLPVGFRYHDYADVCVMPMFPGTSCSPGVAAWKLSA